MNILDGIMLSELCVLSNFTFLTGASHPEEYMCRAAELGMGALAIADVNSVAGIVRAHARAREMARLAAEHARAVERDGPIGPPKPAHLPDPPGLSAPRLIPGARLVLQCGLSMTALPRDRAAWGRLCRLLTLGRQRAPKGDCELHLEDLLAPGAVEGLHLLLHPPQVRSGQRGAGEWLPRARALTRRLGGQMHLVLTPGYDGQDRVRLAAQAGLARGLHLPVMASSAPLMHESRRRRMAA
ncbi:error-prone DNA polymerase, partial [Pseudooceanicola sp. HF7]|nr:error-prone DNA polymerase [Pseudooceanicola sp. HF7]